MAADPDLPSTVDALLAGVRAELEQGVGAYAEQLTRAAAAERAHAVEQARDEVRRAAQEQLVQARDEAGRQIEELRRSSELQISELKQVLDDLRRSAQQKVDAARAQVAEARAAAEAEVARVRREAEQEVEDLRRATEGRLAGLGRELDSAHTELASLRQQLEDAEDRASNAVPSASGRQAHLADAVRSLDDAASLGDVLDRLTQAVIPYCDRAALLVLRDGGVREWRSFGFAIRAAGPGDGWTIEDAGMAGTAAREARVLRRADAGGPPLPLFARGAEPHEASALPVTVAGSVVAVLYAEVVTAAPQLATWVADLEVLTRHGGRVLEAITIQQATGVRAPAAARAAGGAGRLARGAS